MSDEDPPLTTDWVSWVPVWEKRVQPWVVPDSKLPFFQMGEGEMVVVAVVVKVEMVVVVVREVVVEVWW